MGRGGARGGLQEGGGVRGWGCSPSSPLQIPCHGSIKSLGDRPSTDPLVAPTVGIWVTSNFCKGDGEGDTGRLKAPFHPPSGGINAASSEAHALLNLAAPRVNGAPSPKPHGDSVREITPVSRQVWCNSQAVCPSSAFLWDIFAKVFLLLPNERSLKRKKKSQPSDDKQGSPVMGW